MNPRRLHVYSHVRRLQRHHGCTVLNADAADAAAAAAATGAGADAANSSQGVAATDRSSSLAWTQRISSLAACLDIDQSVASTFSESPVAYDQLTSAGQNYESNKCGNKNKSHC